MKIVLISDLHLGKSISSSPAEPFSNSSVLWEMQKSILRELEEKISSLKPDVVAIAGDVFDKPKVSVEVMREAIDFVTRLSEDSEIILISGNHDYTGISKDASFEIFLSEPLKNIHVFTPRDIPKIAKGFSIEIGDKRFIPIPYPSGYRVDMLSVVKESIENMLMSKEYDYVVGHFFVDEVAREIENYEDIIDYDVSEDLVISKRAIKGFGLLGHYHVLTLGENYAYPSSIVPPIVKKAQFNVVYPSEQAFLLIEGSKIEKISFNGIKLISAYVGKNRYDSLEALGRKLMKIKHPYVRLYVESEAMLDISKELRKLSKAIGREFVCKIHEIPKKTVAVEEILAIEEKPSIDRAVEATLAELLSSIDRDLAKMLWKRYREHEEENPKEIALAMLEAIKERLGGDVA